MPGHSVSGDGWNITTELVVRGNAMDFAAQKAQNGDLRYYDALKVVEEVGQVTWQTGGFRVTINKSE